MSSTSSPDPSDKRALRAALVEERLRLPPADRAERSARIAARVLALDAFAGAQTVALYAAIGAEVDPGAIGHAAVAARKRVAYPRFETGSHALRFARAAPEALVPGPHRTVEPPPTAEPVSVSELDLVLVPGVGFDTACRRLGRGRGHYDATLAALPAGALRIGLAFEVQLVPEIPQEPHDEALDAVVTEARVLWRPR